MKRSTVFVLTILVLVSALGRWHAAPADEDEETPVPGPQRVITEGGVAYVKLAPDTQKAIGLTTRRLKAESYRSFRRAYGRVVQLGELLKDYRQLGSARARVAQAHARLDASSPEYRRLKGLFRQGRNVSQKDVQAARAAWLSDRADATAAGTQRSAVTAEIEARWGGTIAQWLRDDSRPFQALLAGRSRLVRASLPPDEVPAAPPRQGQVVVSGGQSVKVGLVSPAPASDSGLQGRSYYFLAHAAVEKLSYGLKVTVLLPYGSERLGVIVPDSAVVWARGGAWAYVQRGEDRFQRVPVSTDRPVPEGLFQANGLGPGTRIVVGGAQVLYSAQALAGTPNGGSSEGEED